MTDPQSPPRRPGIRRSHGWLIALTLLIAWVVVLTFVLPRPAGKLGTSPVDAVPGSPQADFSWTLEGLDGKPVPLERFRGRAIFLNVWATWCRPCLDELPSISNLAADPRLTDVAFLAVSVDEDPGTLRRFVDAGKLKLPVYRASSLPSAFQTPGIPATFLISPEGRIVGSLVGSARWDTPETVEMLEALTRKSAGSRAPGQP